MSLPKASSNRLLVLLGALILNLAAGSVYVFGAYSSALKSSSLTQTDLQLIATLGNVGLYVAVFAGLFYDRRGATQTAIVGTCIASLGYFLAYLASRDMFGMKQHNWILLALSFMIAWHGGAWLDCAAVTTAVKLFPENRGLIVGVVKSFFGLSASVLAQVYLAFFTTESASTGGNRTTNVQCPHGNPPAHPILSNSTPSNTPDNDAGVPFLLFLAVFTIGIGVVGTLLLTERHNGSVMRADEKQRVNRGYIIICILAVFLATVAAVENMVNNGWWMHMACFLLMNVVLLPLWLLPWGLGGTSDGAQVVNAESPLQDHPSNSSSSSSSSNGAKTDSISVADSRNFTVCQTLQHVDFWMLWFCHFCGTANGLFFINNISQIDQSLGGAKSTAALYVSILSVFNAVGRMAAGFMSDRYKKISTTHYFFSSVLCFS